MANCAGKMLDLSQPGVMGVLNVTPDSLSDGGRYFNLMMRRCAALKSWSPRARRSLMSAANPPGRARRQYRFRKSWIGCCRWWNGWRGSCPIPISVDTSKPEVMREAGAKPALA
jgi:dihydropteroate synthase